MYILKGQALMSINIQAGGQTKIHTPSALTTLGKIAAGRLSSGTAPLRDSARPVSRTSNGT